MMRERLDRTHAWMREERMYDQVLPLSFLCGVLIFLLYFFTLAAPLSFPAGSLMKVSQGSTVRQVGEQLKAKHLIRSTFLFEAATYLSGRNKPVIAGEYFFPGPQNVVALAGRLVSGDYEVKAVRVTVPEGATAQQISDLLAAKLADFDAQLFFALAKPKEGKLFPDTYFFLPGEDADLVLTAMLNNFNEHLAMPEVVDAIQKYGKPLPEVLVMASLLEKEAPDTKNRQLIAGILWKRIELGMLLQVDAVFPYIIGKNSLQLTLADLQTDSPYNTYTNKGLPPGPIANPSLDAILAAVTPTKSNYLYYLSDLHGTLHYSATYAGQLSNKRKYLGS